MGAGGRYDYESNIPETSPLANGDGPCSIDRRAPPPARVSAMADSLRRLPPGSALGFSGASSNMHAADVAVAGDIGFRSLVKSPLLFRGASSNRPGAAPEYRVRPP